MKKHYEHDSKSLRNKIIGLGQNSVRKTYFREYQENLSKLERFNALLSKVHDSIFIIDHESFNIVEAYVTDEELFRLGEIGLVNKYFPDLFVYKDRLSLEGFLSRATTEDTFNIITQVSSKFNRIQNYVEINIDVSEFSDEKFAVAIIRNVNDRVQTAKQLELNEGNLKAIIEYTTDLIWSIDTNYRIITFNNNFKRTFEALMQIEVKKGTVLYSEAKQVFDGWIYNRTEMVFKGSIVEDELAFPLGGELRYMEIKLYPIFSKDVIVGAAGFAKDISERKKYEAEIERHRNAMESAIDGMAILDPDSRYIYTNKSYAQIFGYEDQMELKGLNWRELYPQEEIGRLEISAIPTLHKKGYWSGETVGKLLNGKTFNQEISLNKLESGEIVCVVRNIDERKKFEKELEQAKELAERSDRLKTEFLAQMSHEIRTPINTMLSFLGLLREEFDDYDDENIQTGFKIIKNSGDRIIRTIDLLLNMSELQVGTFEYKPRAIDLCSDILEEMYLEYKLVAKDKGLELIMDTCCEEKCYIYADHYAVSKIFDNLYNNAIKYTETGSIKTKLRKDERRVYIDIIDTGIGISEEYLPKLFDPFTQEEQGYTRKFEGNGLGLALVKKYCELNGADIRVKSKKGAGATFTLIFKKYKKV